MERSSSEEETYVSHSISSGATICSVSTVDLVSTLCSKSTGASIPTVRTTESDSPNTVSLNTSSSASTIKSDDKICRARGEPIELNS